MGEPKREKRYVPVVVRFDAEGQLRPLTIEFDEGHKYPVDKVLDVCRAACQTVGGVGGALYHPHSGAGTASLAGKEQVVCGGNQIARCPASYCCWNASSVLRIASRSEPYKACPSISPPESVSILSACTPRWERISSTICLSCSLSIG